MLPFAEPEGDEPKRVGRQNSIAVDAAILGRSYPSENREGRRDDAELIRDRDTLPEVGLIYRDERGLLVRDGGL